MSTQLFGTDGIRCKVGTSPLQQQDLAQIGQAVSTWLCTTYGNSATVLIAHDTRVSCSFIKAALCSGLLLKPLHVTDAGVLPTPAVFNLVVEQQLFDCGIVISASHNPFYDNGLKIITRNGKLSQEQELELSTLIATTTTTTDINYLELGTLTTADLEHAYKESICSFFKPSFLQGIKIVLDCAHGAASTIAPALFKQFGAEVITLHNQPNGININHQAGSTHPAALQQAVLHNQAAIGFAFDGDADRLVAVNHYGDLKDGDDILALLSTHERYMQETTLVGTIMSNQGLAVHLGHHNKKLIRTPVGDKHVAQQLKQENLLLGAEPSGHIIAADYMLCSDAIFIALRLMQAIITNNNWDMQTCAKMPQLSTTINVQDKKDLTQEPFASLIAHYEKQVLPGRLVIRYSGTEPVVRIMIEAEQNAQAVLDELIRHLMPLLTTKGIFYETKEKFTVQNS